MEIEQVKEELRSRISKCNRIILGLQSHAPFNELLDDYKAQMKHLDESWQWITEDKILKEAQITKMAYLSVINAIDNYKHDLEQAEKHLTELDNPDKITGKDYDNA